MENQAREQGTKQRPQKLNTSNFIESWLEATQSSQIFQRIYNRHSCATGCSLNIVFFPKNSGKFATSPSSTRLLLVVQEITSQ